MRDADYPECGKQIVMDQPYIDIDRVYLLLPSIRTTRPLLVTGKLRFVKLVFVMIVLLSKQGEWLHDRNRMFLTILYIGKVTGCLYPKTLLL